MLYGKERYILTNTMDFLAENRVDYIWNDFLQQAGHSLFWEEITICWHLWQSRNERLFASTQLTPFYIVSEILSSFNAGYFPKDLAAKSSAPAIS